MKVMVGLARILSLALLIAALSPARDLKMRATAYSRHGRTATGAKTGRGVIAADPRVLPLGSKVKLKGAGRYSGTYVVADTGRRIRGRKIDVFVPSRREALRFGKRPVRVKVLKRPRRPERVYMAATSRRGR